jgi:16S rRNA (adenine1518-N6/adenine1519-N6)-dimethyltransferase
LRARKELGQHFLHDSGILSRIAAASGAGPNDVVLEIGPGPGGLTGALLDTGATVVAIERDPRMASVLSRQFTGRDFVLVEGDALQMDWAPLVAPWKHLGRQWRVVGNIPYYITSPLIDRALQQPMPVSITYLVQREVARRLVAQPGGKEFGALTIGVGAVAAVTVPLEVGRGAFRPPPKVDSSVIHLIPRQDALVGEDEIPAFRRLVVSAFSYRRKRMGRAVREALGMDAQQAEQLLARAGINPDLRPEQIAIPQWVALYRSL